MRSDHMSRLLQELFHFSDFLFRSSLVWIVVSTVEHSVLSAVNLLSVGEKGTQRQNVKIVIAHFLINSHTSESMYLSNNTEKLLFGSSAF